MISLLAKEDLQDLRDAGLQPTDEDVIRLHALACRLTDGEETTAACAPRHAICGGCVFWEPTLAAWDWYFYAKDIVDESIVGITFAFACLHGREVGFLSNLRDPPAIELELGKFIASLTATREELERAINYVTLGSDYVEPEKTEIEKKREQKDDRVRSNYVGVEKRIRKAAAATGLTLDEIMGQNLSRLDGMIYEANVLAGMTMTNSTARHHAEYLATLRAIKDRLRKEKESAVTPQP